VSEKTAAVKAFEWAADLRHAPGPPEVVTGGFQSGCRCGYAGKRVTSSPSHAYQATRVHAENENRREAGGGVVVQVEDYSRSGEPPKTRAPRPAAIPGQAPSRASVGVRAASRAGAGTPCGCGCGESSGGLFRPGHDSKLLSRLLGEIRSGSKTLEEAHAEMTTIGTSEVLREKLSKKVNT
jgi:hypothetical protein